MDYFPCSPLRDGDFFTSGRYNCTIDRIPESNSWIVKVVDAQSGGIVFKTTPVTSKFEAYQLAIDWLDHLHTDPLLESVLARHDVIVEADAGVLHVTPVAAMADVA